SNPNAVVRHHPERIQQAENLLGGPVVLLDRLHCSNLVASVGLLLKDIRSRKRRRSDPVPLRAPIKTDSSATAGTDSTPDALIPCLGALGPIIDDESVVNVTNLRNGNNNDNGMEREEDDGRGRRNMKEREKNEPEKREETRFR